MPDHDWAEVFTQEYEQPESTVAARHPGRTCWATSIPPNSLPTATRPAGGPGLWVAATTGAHDVGVDIAVPARVDVDRRAERLGLSTRVRAVEGSFDSLPLDDDEAGAIVSIDALLFAPDKSAAAAEMARVLRPGGRLVATTWDYHTQPVGRPPQVSDHRPLLADVGLDVEVYDETVDWDQRQRAIAERLFQSIDELADESGEDPAILRQGIEEMAATQAAISRRVLMVAVLRPVRR